MGTLFEELAAQFIFGLWLFYGLAATGPARAARSATAAATPIRVLGYPLVPLLASVAALLGAALLELPALTLMNLTVTALGVPFYFVWRLSRRRP